MLYTSNGPQDIPEALQEAPAVQILCRSAALRDATWKKSSNIADNT